MGEGAGEYGGSQAITLGMGEHSDGLQVTWDPSLEEPKFISVVITLGVESFRSTLQVQTSQPSSSSKGQS